MKNRAQIERRKNLKNKEESAKKYEVKNEIIFKTLITFRKVKNKRKE